MKVRLVGGPFGGKLMDHPGGGRDRFLMQGPKRMTRKQQYEWHMAHKNDPYQFHRSNPFVRAEYEIVIQPFGNNDYVVMAPCRHPDGSVFFQYVEGSKREVDY